MIIAFTSEENKNLESNIGQHFGKCPYYVFINLNDDNKIIDIKTIENPYLNQHNSGDVPNFIAEHSAEVIITGGMGARAVEFFNEFNIKVVTGAVGTIQDALDKFLAGDLKGVSSCDDGCE